MTWEEKDVIELIGASFDPSEIRKEVASLEKGKLNNALTPQGLNGLRVLKAALSF